jgi:hypothetical protein
LRDEPPLLVMVMFCVAGPGVMLKVREPGVTVSAGGAETVSVTPTDCGLPPMAAPALLTAASEMLPL